MQRPAGLTPQTVSILLVVLSGLIFLSQIISLATPWYNISASGSGFVARVDYGLLAACSSFFLGTICVPYAQSDSGSGSGSRTNSIGPIRAGGAVAFTFGFFALLLALASIVFWGLRLRFSNILSKLPLVVAQVWGRVLLAIPVLCIISWIAWVGGYANAQNNSGSSQALPVVGGPGLAFSIISTLLSFVAVVGIIWNSDQVEDLNGGGGATPAAPAPTPTPN